MSEEDVSSNSDQDGEDEDWFESAIREDESEERHEAADTEAGMVDTEEGESESPFADDSTDESPFGGEESSAFGADTAEDSFGGGEESPFDGDGETNTFGAGRGESPFDDDGASGLFDEDFASAFESAGPGESEEAFDEEEFDTEIPRLNLGIDGLDEMIQGGIPERSLMTVIGAPGTGKTTFGLQFLNHGLANGENAVFITLEQSHDAILDTANEWGWQFDRYEDEGRLAIIDLDPVEMANSLDNIRGELPALVQDFGADRLVLDSVSLLEMMYTDQANRRTEVFDFTRSLKAAGVTTFLTSEASEDNPYASRYGVIEYLTDAVFILQYVRGETQETRLAVEIQKIRNANHSRQTKPYEITTGGISVYQQASIF